MRAADFTTLIGAELHGPALSNGMPWHLLALGLPINFAPPAIDETGPQIAARAARAHAFVGILHPAWSGVVPQDIDMLESVDSIEVYNEGHYRDSDRGCGWYLSDIIATNGRRLTAFASDDAHLDRLDQRFGAWVYVRAAELSPSAILGGLKAGHFYSSTGPILRDIWLNDQKIHVACTPATAIFALGRGSLARSVRGRDITECQFDARQFLDGFCRITVVDEAGKRAWSNPFWFDRAVLI